MQKTSSSSGAAKRRKKSESVKNMFKLTAYFTRRETAGPEKATSFVPVPDEANIVDFVTNAADDALLETTAEAADDHEIMTNTSVGEQPHLLLILSVSPKPGSNLLPP